VGSNAVRGIFAVSLCDIKIWSCLPSFFFHSYYQHCKTQSGGSLDTTRPKKSYLYSGINRCQLSPPVSCNSTP